MAFAKGVRARFAKDGSGLWMAWSRAAKIDPLMKEDDFLKLFCDSIVKNKSIGTFDGAFKVGEFVRDKKAQ
jgi:hypothetical protein